MIKNFFITKIAMDAEEAGVYRGMHIKTRHILRKMMTPESGYEIDDSMDDALNDDDIDDASLLGKFDREEIEDMEEELSCSYPGEYPV